MHRLPRTVVVATCATSFLLASSLTGADPPRDPAEAARKGAEAFRAGNHRRAVQLFRAACDGGTAGACYSLGFMYEGGQGGLAKDERRAGELYRQACDGGVAGGCSNLERLGGR